MQIRRADMFLIRALRLLWRPLWHVGNLESLMLAGQLKNITLDRPVFICGLARSGSTMLLELFSQMSEVATHRYRDFPFVAVPWLWNHYLDWTTGQAEPAVQRPHGDGIMITRESPEAMDEPLWQAFGADLPLWQLPLGTTMTDHPLLPFISQHLRKLMLIRGGRRIVAKNNYHVARIPLLAATLDAQFVIPVRHPVEHVRSLMRQHAIFCGYTQADPRVPEYLKAVCHFEFGPQRRAFCPTPGITERVEQLWRCGQEAAGYATQWTSIYRYVGELLNSPQLSPNIHLVKYEEFCQQPQRAWINLCQAVGLAHQTDQVSLEHIAAPSASTSPKSDIDQIIWSIAHPVATQLGYKTSAAASA